MVYIYGSGQPDKQPQVPIDRVFGAGSGGGAVVARLNVEGQHRGAVAAARAQQVCVYECVRACVCVCMCVCACV